MGLFLPALPFLAILVGVVVGLIANSSIGNRRPGALIGLGIGGAIVGVILGVVASWALAYLNIHFFHSPEVRDYLGWALVIGVTLIGAVMAAWLIGRTLETPEQIRGGSPRSVGVTADGTPIYPVVGYTAQGQPVTADKVATGSPVWNPRTNALAIVTLVLAFIFPLAALPTGHIARSQIRRTGEHGAGIALAGLIISYLWVIGVVIVLIAMTGLSRHL